MLLNIFMYSIMIFFLEKYKLKLHPFSPYLPKLVSPSLLPKIVMLNMYCKY